MAIAPDNKRNGIFGIGLDEPLDVEFSPLVANFDRVDKLGQNYFAGAIRAETAHVPLRFLAGRFFVSDEDGVEADVPQDLGETVFGESAIIEIVVARFPVLITDDLGDAVNQIGAPVIEDGNDMDDGRLLASGANRYAELNTRKHFV